MRASRPARAIVTSVIATWLRVWVHLPRSPGRTDPPANLRWVIDPSRVANLAVHCCHAPNPTRYRSGLGANATPLEDVGLKIPSVRRLLLAWLIRRRRATTWPREPLSS